MCLIQPTASDGQFEVELWEQSSFSYKVAY